MKRLLIKIGFRGFLDSFHKIFFYLSIAIFMISCEKNDNINERVALMRIESYTIQNGTIPESDQLVECMVAIEENTNITHYLYIGRIDGFEYEKGFEYQVKVLIIQIKNPPMDGHTENFKLLEIISKMAVNEH